MDELKKYLQENRTQLDRDEPRPQMWEAIRAAAATAKAAPLSVAPNPAEQVPVKAAARVVPLRKILSWAAAACVLALAGIGGWNLYTPSNQENLAKAVNPSPLPQNPTPSKPDGPAQSATDQNLAQAVPNNPITHGAKKAPSKSPVSTPTAVDPKQFARATAPQGTPRSAPAGDYMAQLENGFSAMLAAQKNRVNTTPMYAESAAYFRDFKLALDNLEKDEQQLKKEIQQKGLRDDQLDALINLYQQKLTILKQLQLEMNKTNNRYKQQRGPIDTSRSYFISI